MRRAFSLVETLVVLGIVTVLFLLAVPGYQQMTKSSRVTVAGRTIIDELSLAQQTAVSRNTPVEVRFYKIEDPTRPNSESYRALQLFLYHNDQNIEPLGKVAFLPPGTAIMQDPAKSSFFLPSDNPLIDPAEKTSDMPLPNFKGNPKYISFRYRSNGETDMTGRPAFLTVVSVNDPVGATGLPANFFTVQIDPLSGRTRTFRP